MLRKDIVDDKTIQSSKRSVTSTKQKREVFSMRKFLQANKEIREAKEKYKVPNWVIAKELGVHEGTFGRWLRFELPPEKKARVKRIIEENKVNTDNV